MIRVIPILTESLIPASTVFLQVPRITKSLARIVCYSARNAAPISKKRANCPQRHPTCFGLYQPNLRRVPVECEHVTRLRRRLDPHDLAEPVVTIPLTKKKCSTTANPRPVAAAVAAARKSLRANLIRLRRARSAPRPRISLRISKASSKMLRSAISAMIVRIVPRSPSRPTVIRSWMKYLSASPWNLRPPRLNRRHKRLHRPRYLKSPQARRRPVLKICHASLALSNLSCLHSPPYRAYRFRCL